MMPPVNGTDERLDAVLIELRAIRQLLEKRELRLDFPDSPAPGPITANSIEPVPNLSGKGREAFQAYGEKTVKVAPQDAMVKLPERVPYTPAKLPKGGKCPRMT